MYEVNGTAAVLMLAMKRSEEPMAVVKSAMTSSGVTVSRSNHGHARAPNMNTYMPTTNTSFVMRCSDQNHTSDKKHTVVTKALPSQA